MQLMQNPARYAALLAQGVEIHSAAGRDSNSVAASKSGRLSSDRSVRGARNKASETVTGYEPQAQCLPLQVCNEQGYVYVGML